MSWRPRSSKFNAVPTVIYGRRFASKAEAARYEALLLLGRAGLVRNLELQPRFPLHFAGVQVSTYVADFRYEEAHRLGPQQTVWRAVVEDVKGVRTPIYVLKKKHVEAEYGFVVRETGRRR